MRLGRPATLNLTHSREARPAPSLCVEDAAVLTCEFRSIVIIDSV
jgi:hypothetical protein